MINKLEKKFGRFAINNLIYYVLGGYLIGYILALFDDRLGLYQYIVMDPALVMKGQVWRLFTWVLTPPQALSIWIIFMFLLYYFIGKSLEATLGAFRYNLYMFSGWFFTTIGAMAVYWITTAIYGPGLGIGMNVSTYYINMASFLAFAVLFPNVQVYLFGIIPLKMKVLAWIDVGYLLIEIISSLIIIFAGNTTSTLMEQVFMASYNMPFSYLKAIAITDIVSILISLLNFLIFFISNKDVRRMSPGEIKRRSEFRKKAEAGRRQNAEYMAAGESQEKQSATGYHKSEYRAKTDSSALVHKCDVCGRTSATNPELQFRYCSKCDGNHEYCQDHIFTHVHIKDLSK